MQPEPQEHKDKTRRRKSTLAKGVYVGNYELQQTLGEGAFAKVKLGIHRLTNQKVAIKIIDKTKLPDEYSMKNIHREAQILRILDHPNIVKLFEVMETKKNLFLILEYASKGELLDYIVSKGRLKEEEAKRFTKQIMSALVQKVNEGTCTFTEYRSSRFESREPTLG
jgi:MAP/microtubule affinity-regulating kinase